MSRETVETCAAKIVRTRAFLREDLFNDDYCRGQAGTIPGDEELSGFRYDILLRARSLAKACHLRVQFNLSNYEAGIIQLEDTFENLVTLIHENKDLTEKQMVAALQGFVYDCVSLIDPHCSKPARKKVLKELSQAEVYSITFHNNEAAIEVPVGDDSLYRIEKQNDSCSLVRAQYLELLDEEVENPEWFERLPEWEQVFLKKSVERSEALQVARLAAIAEGPEDAVPVPDVNYLTKDFFTMKTPAGSSRPGGSNFSRDFFTVRSVDEDRDLISTIYSLSTPSKFRQDEASDVLVDFFENYVEKMIADFHARYPDAVAEEGHNGDYFAIPVLLESLLTPAWYDQVAQSLKKGFSDNNSRMLDYKHEAIDALREYLEGRPLNVEGNIYQFNLIENNQPLNGRRSHVSNPDAPRLVAGFEIIRQSLETILKYDSHLNADARAMLIRICAALQSRGAPRLAGLALQADLIEQIDFGQNGLYMEALQGYLNAWSRGKASPDSENHALYLASCEAILIQESGGVVQINCKSSKDRAGLDKATIAFHRTCYARGWGFPRYGHQFVDERQRNLFRDFVTRVPGEVSHRVAPGCRGIKDEPFMRDAMVPTFATRDRRFKLNKALASTNHIKEKKLVSGSDLDLKIRSIADRHAMTVEQPGETVDAAVTRYLNTPDIPETDQHYFGELHALDDGAIEFQSGGFNDLRSTLYKEIFDLKREKSRHRGIKTRMIKHAGDAVDGYAKFTLVRDARDMNLSDVDEEALSAYNYTQIAMTYCIAAETVFELENLSERCLGKTGRVVVSSEEFRQSIYDLVKEFKDEVLQLGTEKEQEQALDAFILKKLVPMLEEASGGYFGKKDALRLLNQTKNWVAMYQPTLAVATVDRVKSTAGAGVVVARCEEPLTKLTPELLEEYNNRAEKDWYLCQSRRVQRLIDHFVPYILQGHQIPSQLRRYLPGLKNSYRSTTSCASRNEDGYVCLQKLSDSHHCAAIVPVIMPNHKALASPDPRAGAGAGNPLSDLSEKEVDKRMRRERVRLTKLGLLQQRMITGSGSNTMVALNSTMADDVLGVMDFFKGTKTEALDKEMAMVTMAAASELDNSEGAKVCLNEFRLFEPNKDKAIKKFRKKVKRFFRQFERAHGADHRELVTAMRASLERLKKRYSTSRLSRIFNKMDKESIGAKQVQEFTLLSDLYNRMLATLDADNPLHRDFKTHVPFYACASGENRTGVIEFATQVGALEYNLPIMAGVDVDLRSTISRMANSGHLQFITGSQGGIMGTESIRDKSLGSLLKKMKFTDNVISKRYAGYKSPSKKAVAKLLKGHSTAALSDQAGVKRGFFDASDILTPENDVTMRRLRNMGRSLLSLRENHQLVLGFIGSEQERDEVIVGLLTDCRELCSDQIGVEEFSDLIQQFMKKLSAFAFNVLNAAAWNDAAMPDSIKAILVEMSELMSNRGLRAVAEFTPKDLKIVKKTLKKNRYFKIGAIAGLAVTSLFFPATALVAAKFSGVKALAAAAGISLKAKIAADVTMAGAAGLAARSRASAEGRASARGTVGTLFNRARGTSSVETVERVLKNMVQFSSTFNAFREKFSLSRKTVVQVTRTAPLASDLRREDPTPDVEITTDRRPTGDNVVVEVDLHYSKKQTCKALNKKLDKEAGCTATPPSNRMSLSFHRNNLQAVQVERGGRFVPARTLVKLLHSQGKSEIVLTGVLTEKFVRDIRKTAASFHPPMRVKDNRDLNEVAQIHGENDQRNGPTA